MLSFQREKNFSFCGNSYVVFCEKNSSAEFQLSLEFSLKLVEIHMVRFRLCVKIRTIGL